MEQSKYPKYVPNSFYWDDMTISPFRGIFDPKEALNGQITPLLTLSETIRLKLYLDTKYYLSDMDKNNTFGVRIDFINNFTLIIYYDNFKLNEIIEPIRHKDSNGHNRLYYPIHSPIDWEPVLLY